MLRLINCHSNIVPGKFVNVKSGYTFVFLTEAGFCLNLTQERMDFFQSTDKIKSLLTSSKQNHVFRKANNNQQYVNFKTIYNSHDDMPDMEIEFAKVIGNTGGIYKLPLQARLVNSKVKQKMNELKNIIKNETGINNPTDPSHKSLTTPLPPKFKEKYNAFLKFKEQHEIAAGRLNTRTYGSVEVKTVGDFATKHGKELKKKGTKLIRAKRTLSSMMNRNSEFYVQPGIYIVLGCRTIGYEDEPTISGKKRVRPNNVSNTNVYNGALKKVRQLNKQASKTKLLF